ncbi:MAG: YceI family protein, partial [Steroidobacteraceae bacterium]
ISMPVHYERRAGELIVSGEGPLRQSDLGLTPFTALMGALAVQDEMRVRFRIVARAANTGAEPAH